VILPAWVVTAVAEVPGGAKPSYAAGYYERDNSAYQAWDEVGRDREEFTKWLNELTGVKA
jgi:glutaconate CoA-transferase subunit A